MSNAAPRTAFEAFVRDFVVPLLEGSGSVHIGACIAAEALETFVAASSLDTAEASALGAALERAVTAFAPVRVRRLTEHELAFALALHDLAWLTDPLTERVGRRGSREDAATSVRTLLRHAGPPRTRHGVLVRHALWTRLTCLTRTDSTVETWAYTHRFFGRAVPWNVISFPRVRRVRRSDVATSMDVLLREEALVALRNAALAHSPLSALLEAPPAALGPVELAVLEDRVLRGLVVRHAASPDGAQTRALLLRTEIAPHARAAHAIAPILDVLTVTQRDLDVALSAARRTSTRLDASQPPS